MEPPEKVTLIEFFLGRLGFAAGGRCEMNFYHADNEGGLYDEIAVGVLPHHQIDDGSGYAGDEGFIVELLHSVPVDAHRIAPEVARDHDRLAIIADTVGLPLLDALLEASSRLRDERKPDSTPRAVPPDIKADDGLMERFVDGEIGSHDLVASLVGRYTGYAVGLMNRYNEGEIDTDEFVDLLLRPNLRGRLDTP